MTIFGTNIPETTGQQTAIQFPTSRNICFYTTWGNRIKEICTEMNNKRQKNRRLDRIKIWSQWSELMKYIVYLLTIVLPAIKRVAGDTFVIQQAVHQRIGVQNDRTVGAQNPRFYLSGSVVPQQHQPQSGWLQALGDHATTGLSDDVKEYGWTQEATGWNLVGSGAEHYWHCCQCMEKPSACLCSRKGPTYRTLTVAFEQWDIWINCQPEWPKCKPTSR